MAKINRTKVKSLEEKNGKTKKKIAPIIKKQLLIKMLLDDKLSEIKILEKRMELNTYSLTGGFVSNDILRTRIKLKKMKSASLRRRYIHFTKQILKEEEKIQDNQSKINKELVKGEKL